MNVDAAMNTLCCIGIYDSTIPATNSMLVFIDNVKCSNRELNLLECSYNASPLNKQHSNDVGVQCKECK